MKAIRIYDLLNCYKNVTYLLITLLIHELRIKLRLKITRFNRDDLAKLLNLYAS